MIFVDSSNNNIIYHNNLINNFQNANDSENNLWYNTILKEGNYWDDYNGTDANADGIGDTQYAIPGGYNVDEYPLMIPINESLEKEEFIVDYESVFTMLVIGIIISIIFVLPIAYYWRKKYFL